MPKDHQDEAHETKPPPSKKQKTNNSNDEMAGDEQGSGASKEGGKKEEAAKSVDGDATSGGGQASTPTPRLNLIATTTHSATGGQTGQVQTPNFDPAALSAQFALTVRAHQETKAQKQKEEKLKAEEKELAAL